MDEANHTVPQAPAPNHAQRQAMSRAVRVLARQAAIKEATSTEAVSKRAEAAKQGMQKAIANFRELSEMEAQARNNAWKVVQDRMQENMANLQKLLQPK